MSQGTRLKAQVRNKMEAGRWMMEELETVNREW